MIQKILVLMQNMPESSVYPTLVTLVQRLDLGLDLELQLQILTDLRKHFSSHSQVVYFLVHQVLRILPKAQKLARGRVSSRLHDFLKSCIAFCHISVSCVSSTVQQIRLYTLVTQMALQHNMVNQAESILKTCVRLIGATEWQDTAAHLYGGLVDNLLQTMLVFPDNPEKGVQEILLGLKNTLLELEVGSQSPLVKIVLLG